MNGNRRIYKGKWNGVASFMDGFWKVILPLLIAATITLAILITANFIPTDYVVERLYAVTFGFFLLVIGIFLTLWGIFRKVSFFIKKKIFPYIFWENILRWR